MPSLWLYPTIALGIAQVIAGLAYLPTPGRTLLPGSILILSGATVAGFALALTEISA